MCQTMRDGGAFAGKRGGFLFRSPVNEAHDPLTERASPIAVVGQLEHQKKIRKAHHSQPDFPVSERDLFALGDRSFLGGEPNLPTFR